MKLVVVLLGYYFNLYKLVFGQSIVCKEGDSLTGKVIIEGCAQEPCTLMSDSNLNVKIELTPTIESEKIRAFSIVFLEASSYIVPNIPEDGCLIQGASCPWPAKKTRILTLNVPIPFLPTKVDYNATLLFINEKNQTLGCFTIVGNIEP